jgi:hypothetical protein
LDAVPNEQVVDEPYIFCYFLGNNCEHRAFALRLKKYTGYVIVCMKHLDEYIPSDEYFGDKAIFEAKPSDFINLIRNARYVCTDSFHATVLSILNKREFFAFKRFSKDNTVSTNSRLDSVLGILDLEKRLFSGEENIEQYLITQTDYGKVSPLLDALKEESMLFLKRAVGVIRND